jgi:hypothetical protein
MFGRIKGWWQGLEKKGFGTEIEEWYEGLEGLVTTKGEMEEQKRLAKEFKGRKGELNTSRMVSGEYANKLLSDELTIEMDGAEQTQLIDLINDKAEEIYALGAVLAVVDELGEVSAISAKDYVELRTGVAWKQGSLITKVVEVYNEAEGAYEDRTFTAYVNEKGSVSEFIMSGVTTQRYEILKTALGNNKFPASGKGLSVVANATLELEELKKTYKEMCFEIEKARRKIAVSESMTRIEFNRSTGQAMQRFDDDDVFMLLQGEEATLKDLTSNLRIVEYAQALETQLRMVERAVGLEVGALEIDTSVYKTATEVKLTDAKTSRQRKRQVQLLTPKLEALCMYVNEAEYVNGFVQDVADDAIVSFGEATPETQLERQTKMVKLFELGLVSGAKVVEAVLGVTEAEAEEMVADARAESASGGITSELARLLQNE